MANIIKKEDFERGFNKFDKTVALSTILLK